MDSAAIVLKQVEKSPINLLKIHKKKLICSIQNEALV